MSDLTDAEKALIEDKSPGDDETAGWEYALLHRTVETILTERLAAVAARAEAAEAKLARVVEVAKQIEADNEESLNRYGQHLHGAVAVCAEMIRAALADEGDTHE